ncbi:MAG: hypothetical protein ACP5HM_14530 [Anaerolineae bacterium]
MMVSEREMEHALAVKRRHEDALMRKANVVSIGLALDEPFSDEAHPVIVVNVTHKVPWEDLAPADRIPRELEGVPVEIEAVGKLRAQQHR